LSTKFFTIYFEYQVFIMEESFICRQIHLLKIQYEILMDVTEMLPSFHKETFITIL
jgi:hypothetical protein